MVEGVARDGLHKAPNSGTVGVTESSRITPFALLPSVPHRQDTVAGPCITVDSYHMYPHQYIQSKPLVHPDMLLTTIPTGAPPAAYSEAHGIACTLSRVGPAHWLFGHPTYSYGFMLRHTSHQRSPGHMPIPLTRLHHGSILMCTTVPTRHSTVHRCLKVVAPASISPLAIPVLHFWKQRYPCLRSPHAVIPYALHVTAVPTQVRMTATTHQRRIHLGQGTTLAASNQTVHHFGCILVRASGQRTQPTQPSSAQIGTRCSHQVALILKLGHCCA
jgi:hypothetical protein